MSPKKSTIDITLVEAKNVSDAMNLIFAGVKYFLIHHTAKTLVTLMLMSIGPIYVAWDYFTSNKIKLEEVSPIGENTVESTVMFASWEDKIPIVIDGKTYGYEHPTWRVKVLEDGSAMIVWNTETKRVLKMNAEFLDKQSKK